MKNPDKIINYWKKEKFVVACIIIFGLSFNSSMINHELLELQDKAIKANILENSMQPIYNVIAMLGIIIVILDQNINTIVLVNGQDYPDVLSSSLVASQNNAAVLLTEPNKLNEDTEKYIRENNIKNVIIVGGEKSVSKNVENMLKDF